MFHFRSLPTPTPKNPAAIPCLPWSPEPRRAPGQLPPEGPSRARWSPLHPRRNASFQPRAQCLGEAARFSIRACTWELGIRPGACSFLTASHVHPRAFHVGSGGGRLMRPRAPSTAARRASRARDPCRTPPATALGDAAAGTGRGAAPHPTAVGQTVFLVCSVFSLDLASFNPHRLLECYFIFPQVYKMGTQPPARCVCV